MDITRDVYEGEGPDGIDVRLYDLEGLKLPSVTTVLKTRDEDTSNLESWKDRNDGEGDNAFHKHLFWYSRHVGTLGHWYALRELDNDLEWSDDEEDSLYKLGNVDELNDEDDHPEVHDATPRDVLYSINKNHHSVESWGEFFDSHSPYAPHSYYNEALLDTAFDDVNFFRDAQCRLWSKLGIADEDVISVEQFLFSEEHGYAGQVDLVYEDTKGDVVVADLKSSSGCYEKHKLQGAAYAKAVEFSDDVPVDHVDRIEVMRAHPRSGQMAVHSNTEPTPLHTSKYWSGGTDIESLWNQFKPLTNNFE